LRRSGGVILLSIFYEISQEMASPVMVVFLLQNFPEMRRNSFSRCKKRTCDVLTVACLSSLENSLFLDILSLFPSGNNKI